MSLIKEFRNRVDRFHEAKRLTERGKGLVDLSKVALVGDFYDRAVLPLLDNCSSLFARYFQKNHKAQRDLLKIWIATDSIDAFPVPRTLMAEDCPHYSYRNIFGEDTGYINHATHNAPNLDIDRDDFFVRAKRVHDFWVRRQQIYPAVHLGQALLSMEWQLVADVEPRELLALLADDGDTVVRFWDAVNALPDYSRHFDDRPPFKDGRPNGKKPKPKRQTNPQWDWVPQGTS